MQTKSSYRVLKWALVATVAASFGIACEIKEGDPDIGDGGDGNTPTAGTKSDGGEEPTAGTKSDGGSAGQGTGGTAGAAGTTSQGGEAAGGEPSTYQPGVCVGDAEIEPSPTMLPSCTPNENDETDACSKCVKQNCCELWQECYGDTPATACGWGLKYEDPGQYDCVRGCYPDKYDELLNRGQALEACTAECANQCDEIDNGLPFSSTSELVDCSSMKCGDECFPL